jgi:hypothetical protein
VSEKSLRNGANHGLLVLAKALPGASGSSALERMQKKIAAAATGGILSSPGKQNGNPGLAHLTSAPASRGGAHSSNLEATVASLTIHREKNHGTD